MFLTYRSRFLRSSAETKEEKEEERPSVTELRRRYDQNRNHVASKPPSGASKSSQNNAAASGSDTESESSAVKTSVANARVQSPAPVNHAERLLANGKEKTSSPARAAVVHKEKPLRSSSPSTLSTSSAASSDNEAEVKVITILYLRCSFLSLRYS